MQRCRDRAPQDAELRERYLRLLGASVWHWDAGKTRLLSEERFRLLLREQVGTAPVVGVVVMPWLRQQPVEGVALSEAAQAEAVAYLSQEEMYHSFATEQAAQQWVAEAAGPLGAGTGVGTEAGAPEPVGPEAEPTPWLVAGGVALLLLLGAAGVVRSTRARRKPGGGVM